MQEKLKEAQRTLELNIYMNKLLRQQKYLQIKYNNDVTEFTEMLFLLAMSMSDRKKNNIIDIRQELLYRYNKAPGLKKFSEQRKVSWSSINLVSHSAPRRNTKHLLKIVLIK